MGFKFRQKDPVIVIAGSDKGMQGTVAKIKGDRVQVNGSVNKIGLVKKHVKSQDGSKKEGNIVEMERFIHISNIAPCLDDKPVKLKCEKAKNGNKVWFAMVGDEKKTYREITTK